MEEVLLCRLTAVIKQIEKLTAAAQEYSVQEIADNLVHAKIKAEQLEGAINRFTTELHEYFRLSTEPSADDISAYSEIQLKGEETLTELKTRIRIRESQGSDTNGKGETSFTSKLPKLELTRFSGDILTWTPFWDQFESNIGNKRLNAVDKLMYLKSTLDGEALKAIEGLESTNSNYEIATSILKERYGKHNLIVDAHYGALYRIKTADRSATSCRGTLNDIERHLRILQSLGENINHNHLRFLILEKFPEDILYELKMKIEQESVEEIRKGLQIIISAREDSARITPGKSAHDSREIYTTKTLYTQDKVSNNSHKSNANKRKQEDNQYGQKDDRRYNTFRRSDNYSNRDSRWQNNQRGQCDSSQRNKGNRPNNRSYGTSDHRTNGLKRRNTSDSNHSNEGKRAKIECIFCKGGHYNDQCQTVKTIPERIAKLNGRCYLCLKNGHIAKACPQDNKNCYFCKKTSHNRALCPQKVSNGNKSTSTLHVSSACCSTILQTAVATAKGEEESKELACRLLLDSGSQRTYVTQQLAKRLKLPVEEECQLSIFTFGAKSPQVIDSNLVRLQILTRLNKVITLHANVVPSISVGVPYPDINLEGLDENLILADDGSLSPDIDILVGNDYYFTLIEQKRINLADNLFLIESKLGWILTGKLDMKEKDVLSALTYFQANETKLTPPDLPLDNSNIKCLWDLESIGICDSPKDTIDEDAIRQFNENTEIVNNRYMVQWPWRDYPPDLPVNFGLAYGRLINLLKRSDNSLLNLYDETLHEQIEEGIIEIIPEEEINTLHYNHPTHYLPHHGINQKEEGKKLRIVYDASAKTKDNKSLNECLQCGPLLLEDLTGIFIRFRAHEIAILADVEKAFLQIGLQQKDRDVTRFLWLKNVNRPATKDNILHLRFCRVPFGVISSPFLLNASIKHHLTYNNTTESLKELANDIYCDNLVTSVKSMRAAKRLYSDAKASFKDISMNLRAWCSNAKEFMDHISEDDQCMDNEVKVLGLKWVLGNDTIQLRCKPLAAANTRANTKREVLRTIASTYDPCGWAVPELLPAKLLLQELWKRKIKWDVALPPDLAEEWLRARESIQSARDISIPRRFFRHFSDRRLPSLHCFVDASTKSYAAVVYITNELETAFVIGKSRLVPIKDHDNLQIPRLELLAALIGCRLVKYVAKVLRCEIEHQTLWTDSKIVIDWYRSNKVLTPFVARRIEEIKRNKGMTIRKVPTHLNPADVATRPYCIREKQEKWLTGPDFLNKSRKYWPTAQETKQTLRRREDLTYLSATQVPSQQNDEPQTSKTKQTVNELPINQESGTCNTQNIKRIQEQHFPREVTGKETDLSRNLGLFIDVDGILRCKGRLRNTNWSFDKRYPILIPTKSDFTDNIIRTTHEDNYHVGVNHTLSMIRQTYWIPKGRSRVQQVLRKCETCSKHNGGPFKLPPTPALPEMRVNYSSPYTCAAMDYFGPLYIRADSIKEEKRWVCLYTCLAVRAIHLEVVKDLTAEECLLALRRFISTRNVPALIVSDNAQQFKLTAEVLADNYCVSNKIAWKFIPQLAPWHGGLYERLVGIVKQCLKKSLTKQLLTENQLVTIIKEIEAVVNTRPLTYVGADLEDVLRPSDFLTMGRCITTEPVDRMIQPSDSVTKKNLIEAWKRGQNILMDFKTMFQNQYLPSLRERYNNSHQEPRVKSSKEPQVGDIVQIKGETKNRENWRVGKIVTLLRGQDGECRVARVKVGDTEFTRSIAHLYPLEMDVNKPVRNLQPTERELVTSSTPTVSLTKKDHDPVDIPQVTADIRDKAPEPMEVELDLELPDQQDAPLYPKLLPASCLENGETAETFETDTTAQIEQEDPAIETEEDPQERKGQQRAAFLKAQERIREWTRDLMSSL